MKRSVVVAAAGMALIALSLGGGAHAQLKGKFRDKYIATQNDKCQTQMVNDGAMSQDLATEYCGCVVDYLADRVTGDKLALDYDSLSRGVVPSWLASVDKDATKQCLTDLKPVQHGTSSDGDQGAAASDTQNTPAYDIPMGLPAGAPDGSGRPEECAKYTIKVQTDPRQSICAK
jgi:hypothetical protein